MNLTGTDIEQDFYNLLRGGSLDNVLSGSIYKSGMRPLGSTQEDVVISFLSGVSNQVQTGIVIINTYVPNQANGLKNTNRVKELETEINNWIALFNNQKYEIELDKTIQVFAEPDINQHFISTRLRFKLLIEKAWQL